MYECCQNASTSELLKCVYARTNIHNKYGQLEKSQNKSYDELNHAESVKSRKWEQMWMYGQNLTCEQWIHGKCLNCLNCCCASCLSLKKKTG